MMKKTYLIFLISLFLFSCNDDKENEDFKNSSEYESLVLGIPQSQIDSIRKSEEMKPAFLKKESYELDSVTTIEVMLPMGNFFKSNSWSGEISLTDPNATSLSEDFEFPTSIGIQNTFSDGDSGEALLVGKSTNPNIFPVSDIKKFNEPEKILFEDKNTLLYVDDFGHKKMYHRQYNPANSTYYLYTADVPRYNDQKLQYASLFSIYKKAQNLLAFDKEMQSDKITWKNIKPTLSEPELKNYELYYKSLEKEVKYFLMENDSVIIDKDKMNFYLYRDDNHSRNTFDQVTILANSKFSGTFEDLDFENRLHSGYFKKIYARDDGFKFIKKISENSILMQATTMGYSTDTVSYYIISSIKIAKDQYYLISPTNENADDLTALMNDYFSKHLKI